MTLEATACSIDGPQDAGDLTVAIVSDGEDGLVVLYSCPVCGILLGTEPLPFVPGGG